MMSHRRWVIVYEQIKTKVLIDIQNNFAKTKVYSLRHINWQWSKVRFELNSHDDSLVKQNGMIWQS